MYDAVPTDVLRRYAAHSERQVQDWTRELDRANESVARARRALDKWTRDRDEQFQALDDRDEPAPESADPYADCRCGHGRTTHAHYTGSCGLCACAAVRESGDES